MACRESYLDLLQVMSLGQDTGCQRLRVFYIHCQLH